MMVKVGKKVEKIKLSNKISIRDYLELERIQNKEGIAAFIKERFTERYIASLKRKPKSGFAIMALSCLMIEALESFRKGWENTRGRSEEAFKEFFKYANENNLKLGEFYPIAEDFYECIRCGLLHQAETTNGWRILRKGPLLDKGEKTINANKFLSGIEQYLDFYCEELKNSDWNAEIWKNLRKKMEVIIKNCEEG